MTQDCFPNLIEYFTRLAKVIGNIFRLLREDRSGVSEAPVHILKAGVKVQHSCLMKSFKSSEIRIFRSFELIYEYSDLFCYIFAVAFRPLYSSYVKVSLNFCIKKPVIAIFKF
ncbi:hypothetical protein SDC9_167694 [bioreactor metagenome]|uniref:Uncharacterized protein n=1 Tax=bioreactor metagenome TaxID=1076179 RepID=A0A645G2C3_9ZZZZ